MIVVQLERVKVRGKDNMLIQQAAEISAPRAHVWAVISDMRVVAACMPGVEAFAQERTDLYSGVFAVRIGPIKVRLEGKVTVLELDETTWVARLKADAADHRLKGFVTARIEMTLDEIDATRTRLRVVTDAAVLGRLGEFGQAIMARKANQILNEFIATATIRIASSRPGDS
jgi:carbon monoxide dehydrogenase subunit G